MSCGALVSILESQHPRRLPQLHQVRHQVYPLALLVRVLLLSFHLRCFHRYLQVLCLVLQISRLLQLQLQRLPQIFLVVCGVLSQMLLQDRFDHPQQPHQQRQQEH
jgi:hypothetical protein